MLVTSEISKCTTIKVLKDRLDGLLIRALADKTVDCVETRLTWKRRLKCMYIQNTQCIVGRSNVGKSLVKGIHDLPASPEPSRLKSSVTSSDTVLCKVAIHAAFSDGFDIRKRLLYRFVSISGCI